MYYYSIVVDYFPLARVGRDNSVCSSQERINEEIEMMEDGQLLKAGSLANN